MPTAKMHPDEVHTDAALVRSLLAAQFPQWAGLPIEPVLPLGTDNANYRLGEELLVRLPRRERTSETLLKERRWLVQLAPRLPLAVPVPLADGEPADAFPFPWAIYTWLGGENAAARPPADLKQAARDLAGFLQVLQHIDPTDGPAPGEHNFGRGEPVGARDGATRAAIAQLAGRIDVEAVTAIWAAALRAPVWQGRPVWIHGDLDRRNLLVEGGRISGVIDFGCLGVGDSACDVMVAWKVLSADARDVLRGVLAIDDATWSRARGWAVSQAVAALSYYTDETNPVLVGEANRWLAEVLAD